MGNSYQNETCDLHRGSSRRRQPGFLRVLGFLMVSVILSNRIRLSCEGIQIRCSPDYTPGRVTVKRVPSPA